MKKTFISANIIDNKSGELLFPPHHIITEGGLTMGVIGLTNFIPAQVRDVQISDFIKAGEAQIAELKPKVDIIVVLANVDRDKNKLMNNHGCGMSHSDAWTTVLDVEDN